MNVFKRRKEAKTKKGLKKFAQMTALLATLNSCYLSHSTYEEADALCTDHRVSLEASCMPLEARVIEDYGRSVMVELKDRAGNVQSISIPDRETVRIPVDGGTAVIKISDVEGEKQAEVHSCVSDDRFSTILGDGTIVSFAVGRVDRLADGEVVLLEATITNPGGTAVTEEISVPAGTSVSIGGLEVWFAGSSSGGFDGNSAHFDVLLCGCPDFRITA